MQAETFFKNKINRQIKWNGQLVTFKRFAKDAYGQLTTNIEREFNIKGIFHEGGGYGGMLNIELYERDGGRTVSKMKPMFLCLYEDAKELQIDDYVKIGDYDYRVVEKNDIKNFNIAFEVSLEIDNAAD